MEIHRSKAFSNDRWGPKLHKAETPRSLFIHLEAGSFCRAISGATYSLLRDRQHQGAVGQQLRCPLIGV